MCVADQSGPISVPSGVADAMAMVRTGLASLAAADPTELPAAVQAECLRFLERAESMQTAARASVLAAFTNHGGYEDDGQGSERSWLQWQTRITRAAAAGAVGWMRRLRDHPAVADALKVAQISSSWARLICDWSDQLPEAARADADLILLAAAAGGAGLADLAGLAEEMRRRTARPDQDGEDDGFADRSVRLLLHYRGAGKLDGELTPQCAAALQAVLDCLGKKAGPEDIRTRMQRHHDALEEACRRLLASGCLPDRAGAAGPDPAAHDPGPAHRRPRLRTGQVRAGQFRGGRLRSWRRGFRREAGRGHRARRCWYWLGRARACCRAWG